MRESTDKAKTMGLSNEARPMNEIEVLQMRNQELQNRVDNLERELLDLYRRLHAYDRPNPGY